jgi:hypothetical protein
MATLRFKLCRYIEEYLAGKKLGNLGLGGVGK